MGAERAENTCHRWPHKQKTVEVQVAAPWEDALEGNGIMQKMENVSQKPELLSQETQQLIHCKTP